MSDITIEPEGTAAGLRRRKFQDPDWTAAGEARASVALERLDTLWFNTGSVCNITCLNCYMESSPKNDRLAYVTAAEVRVFLDELAQLGLDTREIGFTGGEPFMNPDILEMLGEALSRGYEALVLTNAMQPMQRRRVKAGLAALARAHGRKLVIRVSIDHYTKRLHEIERGPGAWAKTIEGLDWLVSEGVRVAIAGRTCWNEDEATARAGYAALIAEHGWPVDAQDRSELVLLPEMDGSIEVPEITTRCWGMLGIHPREIMCATSRMIVKRKGDRRPAVVPCTLLPYDRAFEMGSTLAKAAEADGGMFDHGAVKLCHPHCAKFCVLGGGNCAG